MLQRKLNDSAGESLFTKLRCPKHLEVGESGGLIRHGTLLITQNKTSAKRAIEIVGELAVLIARIQARKRERHSAYLIQDDNGSPLTTLALRGLFDKARKAAGVSFQFRDIRAKTASDTGDLGHSQKLLGHKNRDMTEHYVRERIGQRVKPLR